MKSLLLLKRLTITSSSVTLELPVRWFSQVLCSFFTLTLDLGSAYGAAKSGVGITSMGVLRPDLIIKSVVPVVMAGILGIYGLIVSVIINQKSKMIYELIMCIVGSVQSTNYYPKNAFSHLASGLCNGLSSLVLPFPN